ncbi:MAG: tripartite tricarboxylate transporter TctB family protein [Azospirillaceae bacterium]
MIRTDRILGGVVAAGGAFLLLYLIPTQVTALPERLRDPALFPSIAAWMILGLGLLQIVLPGPDGALPTRRGLVRGLGVFAAIALASIVLPLAGFVATGIGLMAVLSLFMFERRPLWLVVTVVAAPPGVWALFELAFQRPLP